MMMNTRRPLAAFIPMLAAVAVGIFPVSASGVILVASSTVAEACTTQRECWKPPSPQLPPKPDRRNQQKL